MTNFKDFRAKDFAVNHEFQCWVLTPNEKSTRFWNEFLLLHPEKRKDIEKAIEMVHASGLSADAEANEAYLEIWGHINEHAKNAVTDKPKKQFASYALMAAAVIGIVIMVVYYFGSNEFTPIEYKAGYAEVKEIKLEDGSVVTLNSNSTIKVLSAGSGSDNREIFFEGEGFFHVAKMNGKKFIIKTSGDVAIEVLGTEFNVNTRRDNLSVYLQSGSVSVQAPSSQVILEPGEQADYNNNSKKVIISHQTSVEATRKLAWKNNLYILQDTPLSTIAKDIQDTYGVAVMLMDSTLAERSVTAKVPAHDLDLLLKVLEETLQVKIEKKSNEIVITSAMIR